MRRFSRSAAPTLAPAGEIWLARGAPATDAEPIGTIMVIPAERIDLGPIRLRTNAGCSQEADAYNARMIEQGCRRKACSSRAAPRQDCRTPAVSTSYVAQTMRTSRS